MRVGPTRRITVYVCFAFHDMRACVRVCVCVCVCVCVWMSVWVSVCCVATRACGHTALAKVTSRFLYCWYLQAADDKMRKSGADGSKRTNFRFYEAMKAFHGNRPAVRDTSSPPPPRPNLSL